MASKQKTTGPVTPVKVKPSPKTPENSNPNLATKSPFTKSAAKGVKSASRKPNLSAKKNKKKEAITPAKERSESNPDGDGDGENCSAGVIQTEKMAVEENAVAVSEGEVCAKVEVSESSGRVSSGVCRSNVKRGKVMSLIQAFERILTLPPGAAVDDGNATLNDDECVNDGVKNMPLTEILETTTQCSEAESLHLDSGVASSWDGSHSQESISKRTSGGGRRSRRNSSDSSGTSGVTRSKKKKLRITNQKPFKLRTEQRGKVKEVELLSKIQQMIEDQEKKRLRIAQGLPWTTDEPQCLVKPPVKDITRPLDVKLHTDMRAVERAEFDHQVAEKLSLFEQYKMERVRQQKLAEEEEIRRLRKELVPKAQPMPFFDRPFVPKRSVKHEYKSHNVRRSGAGCSS